MHHPAVPPGILYFGGEHRRARIGGPVVPHQRGQRLGAQEGRVAREDDDILFLVVVIGQAGEPEGERVAGARLRLLLDELDLHGRGGVLHERLGDPLGPVTDHDDDPGDVDLRHGVEDVEDHGGEPASFHGGHS